MALQDKIKTRMDEIQQMMESDNREGIEAKIKNVAKFWSALSEADREYIQSVRIAVEEDLPWAVP